MQTDNQLRRMRLISDILEDYQDNVRRALRLIEMEHTIILNVQQTQDVSGNGRVLNIFENVSSQSEDRQTPIFRTISQSTLSNSDRTGFSAEELPHITTQITYDASMHSIHCPITWDAFLPGQTVLRINECGHIFSRDAIIEWFRRRNHCPVCRHRPLLHP